MTDDQIAAIAARLAAITPGEWKAEISVDEGEFSIWSHLPTDDWAPTPVVLGSLDLLHNPVADANFIANAPDDIAHLLKRVEALEAALGPHGPVAEIWDIAHSVTYSTTDAHIIAFMQQIAANVEKARRALKGGT